MAQVVNRPKLNKKPNYVQSINDLLHSGKPLNVIAPAVRNMVLMLDDEIQPQAKIEIEQQLNLLRDLQDGTYQANFDTSKLEAAEAAPVAANSAPLAHIEAPAPEIKCTRTLDLPPSYSVEIDPVLGQWAIYARLSVPFAQWAILRELARPNNYISRNEALAAIQNAKGDSERNASQILRQGNGLFWDCDPNTGRYYIRAEHRVALRLAELIPQTIVSDNLPGNYRYLVDLQGSKERINAHLYAAWMYSKAENRPGRLYHNHREQQKDGSIGLCELFNVSKGTLLRWEQIAKIETRTQYERDEDTSFENVPKHAYLRLGDNGKVFAEWQLPNAYYPPEHNQRANRGSSSKTRVAILKYLQTDKPTANGVQDTGNSVSSNTGLQKLGQLYFEGNTDNWAACEKHLRKHQDPFTPHRYAIGETIQQGRSTATFARYNAVTNAPSSIEGVRVDKRGEQSKAFKSRKSAWGKALVKAHL